MRIIKPSTMFVASVYMIIMKSNNRQDMIRLRYKNSPVYDDKDKALRNGYEIIEEVYSQIINGEIVFPHIKNFDMYRVEIKKYSDYGAICYRHLDQKFTLGEEGASICEASPFSILCDFSVDKLHLDNNFEETIDYCYQDNLTTMQKFRFCKYGAFWYLIVNVDGNPFIVKRFWWFTGINRMIDYLFNKSGLFAI